MHSFFKSIKGDKAIWAVIALLSLFSFLPVYSASTNLVHVVGNGTTIGHLLKHGMLLVLGFAIIYAIHKIPYHYFKGLSIIAMPIVLFLLVYTLFQGNTIAGANASRWLQVPLIGVTFQTSTLASVVLLIYTARYLSKIKNKTITFWQSFWPLWFPTALILALILPANLSTTALLFFMVLVLCFLGGYPIKYLGIVTGSAVLLFCLFIAAVFIFPDKISNRVDTWKSRIENFAQKDDDNTKKTSDANYQIVRAKTAIATGGIIGKGAGKSVMKNLLPQSSSDFIYAIIVEEYGLIGGLGLIAVYMFLLFRIVVVAYKAEKIYGKLLVISVGLPIVFQALVNMAVAVELFPVTGQTLPLISSGGTSIWMTCLALGIVLSVSAKRQEILEKEHKQEHELNPLEILSEQL